MADNIARAGPAKRKTEEGRIPRDIHKQQPDSKDAAEVSTCTGAAVNREQRH